MLFGRKKYTASAKVLGQLLIMQNMLCSLPDENSIFSFVCRGLQDVPGVIDVNCVEIIPEDLPSSSRTYSIRIGENIIYALLLNISNQAAFAPYDKYLENFCFMLSVVLEERNQRRHNELQKVNLERLVKERTEDLRSSEQRIKILLDNLPQKIYHKDIDSNYVSCNKSFARDLKIESEAIFGTTDYDYYPRELADNFRRNDQKIIKSGEPQDIVWKHVVDGKEYWLDSLKVPVRDGGDKVIGVLGIQRDVTDLKLVEDEKNRLEAQLVQAHKMEAVGTLAGGIAHDFNNILAAILGYAELARMSAMSGESAVSDLNQVLKATKRAKELVRQILTFSRQDDQERKPLQVHLVVKEALKLLRASIPTTIEILDNVVTEDDNVLADPTQIHQIIMNICTNAYHAMREKGGTLAIELMQVEIEPGDSKVSSLHLNPGNYVVLTISDTGTGMTRAVRERIFEPYYTTKKHGEGTGMGLALVHGIVNKHEGHVSVYSEPGKGTSFQVYLPRIMASSTEEEEEGFESIPTGNERILLIDDEEELVRLEKRILENLGYKVTSVTNSDEALDMFKAQADKYDLVMTDMTMPNLTGIELAQYFMEIKPDIPIILCTGFSELINREKAIALGVREYVMKPIVRKELAIVVRKVLDGQVVEA